MTISVIIPCYNSAQWVGSAVESVLAQTRAPDEIIVVDDGSDDDPASALANFGDKVKLIIRKNGGLSAARNTGAHEANGDWFLFLDADDTLFSDALEKLEMAAVSVANAGVIYGYVLQRNNEGGQLHSLPRAAGDPPKPAKASFWWTPLATAGCALINRELNKKVGGFDENFRQVEDAEYWLRCGVTTSFTHTGTMILDKAYHGESLGQKRASSIWYRLQLQRKFLDWAAIHKIDTKFLDVTPRLMVDHALTQAWRAKTWEILQPLLEQATELGVFSPWCVKAKVKTLFLRACSSLPPRPLYCRNVWSLWRQQR